MHVLGAVHPPGPGAGRAARDPVGQPVVERLFGQPGVLPGAQVLVAEAERAEPLSVAFRLRAAHGAQCASLSGVPLAHSGQVAAGQAWLFSSAAA